MEAYLCNFRLYNQSIYHPSFLIARLTGVKDRSIKVWNYESNEIELVQDFEDDVHSVALHPTGLYCVVGFSDKLRYMTITIDEIVVKREFNIRSCKLSSFSRMGHLFASTNGNIINVYCSISFELMYVLKGHNGKVSTLFNAQCVQYKN